MKYAVVFTYSFDDDCAVYLFETWEKALKFLKDNYESEVKIANEDFPNRIIHTEFDEEFGYARISELSDYNKDYDITEMRIGQIYS